MASWRHHLFRTPTFKECFQAAKRYAVVAAPTMQDGRRTHIANSIAHALTCARDDGSLDWPAGYEGWEWPELRVHLVQTPASELVPAFQLSRQMEVRVRAWTVACLSAYAPIAQCSLAPQSKDDDLPSVGARMLPARFWWKEPDSFLTSLYELVVAPCDSCFERSVAWPGQVSEDDIPPFHPTCACEVVWKHSWTTD